LSDANFFSIYNQDRRASVYSLVAVLHRLPSDLKLKRRPTMKKCFLLILSMFAVVTASGQEAGNRIYGNTGYYQQKRNSQVNTGMLGNQNEGYSIEASVLTNLKPDAFVVVFGINDEGSNAATSNEKVNSKITNLTQRLKSLGIDSNDVFIDFITQNRVYHRGGHAGDREFHRVRNQENGCYSL
jgi:predicted MPP superfamily phosphohydrolase